jgi:type 1 fimbria pilin
MRKLLISCAAALLLGAVLPKAQPKQPAGFDLASLNGAYGSRETGDGHISTGLGIVIYDGKGNTTRKFTVNAPDGAGGRAILQFPGVGTYTVNEDGTGVATYNTTLPDGSVAIRTFDFVITGTGSAWHPGKASSVATEISTAQREAGVTVKLVTGIQTRIGH